MKDTVNIYFCSSKIMYISIFELFKKGIGPSSSHTMGPMNAAYNFRSSIKNNLSLINKLEVTLYGSLAYTGLGHKTQEAIILGLSGEKAENITNNKKESILDNNTLTSYIKVYDKEIPFTSKKNIINNFSRKFKKYSNPMNFKAFLDNGKIIESTFSSIGGGFITELHSNRNISVSDKYTYNFNTMNELLSLCTKERNIYDIVLENESSLLEKKIVEKKILDIWNTMNQVIKSGINSTGEIDSILNVKKRANYLHNKIKQKNIYDPLDIMDWINVYAIATCEENASGNRVVTAPTNGAAGIIPAVIKYYDKFISNSNDKGIINFIATASSIGMLFKNNASISGADMGCQGEVGVACSMAAAGLTAALGGTYNQIENAAEIAMEHNLGLTCDPIKGLVQIPCIERNSMGAIKAINASRLALNSTMPHKVSLDDVIKTMYDTGKSMNSIFKETSLGGLAVNVVEC